MTRNILNIIYKNLCYILIFIIPAINNLSKASQNDGRINKSDLREVRRELEEAKSLSEKVKSEEKEINKNTILIKNKIIKLNTKIQNLEYQILILEDRIKLIRKEYLKKRKGLSTEENQMEEIILSLQTIATRPRDTLILQPFDPNNAIRSGLLMSSIISNISERILELSESLRSLYSLKDKLDKEDLKLKILRAHLWDEKLRFDFIYIKELDKKKKLENSSRELSIKVKKLAKEAKDIKELLNKIIEENRANEQFLDSPALKFISQRRPILENKSNNISNKGMIKYPIVGKIIKKYGEPGEKNNILTKGIIIKSLPKSSVVSPADGLIVFSGPFRGYGNILIIQHDRRYHTLISGVEKIMCGINQIVLAGEPIAFTPEKEESNLYIELRKDSNPINPLPWLAKQT